MNPYLVETTGTNNNVLQNIEEMPPFKFQREQLVWYVGPRLLNGWPQTNGARMPTEVPVKVAWRRHLKYPDGQILNKYEVEAKIHGCRYVTPPGDGWGSWQYFDNVPESDLQIERPN